MSIAKYEEKFIVINRKHLHKLNKEYDVERFLRCFEYLDLPEHKYIVCNQDEPYANKVLEIILHNETIKQSLDDVAHEIWTTAQLLPGEGIVDGVDRIVEVLKKQFLFIIGNKD